VIRVVHFIDSLRVGGKERQFVELINGMRGKTAIENFIVCMGREDFYRNDISGIQNNIIYLVRKIRWDPLLFFKLYRIIKKIGPDIIHTNAMLTSFYALPVARACGVRLINGSIRNAFTRTGIKWWIEKWLLDRSDIRLANSLAGLQSRGYEPSDRNVVIHNGFDFSRLPAAHPSEEMPFPRQLSSGSVVGMVAEFNYNKDWATYIAAAKVVVGKRNDVVFLAVGDGVTLDECRKLADFQPRMHFMGSRRNIEEIVSRFTIGVLATFKEGISNSIMEYMALGKPVVASDGGGTKELIIDGETGYLVPPRDPVALADKILFLLSHKELAEVMGERGRQRIKKDFSLSSLAEKTIALYERTAKSH